LLDKYRSQY
jgi:hypothetical protein